METLDKMSISTDTTLNNNNIDDNDTIINNNNDTKHANGSIHEEKTIDLNNNHNSISHDTTTTDTTILPPPTTNIFHSLPPPAESLSQLLSNSVVEVMEALETLLIYTKNLLLFPDEKKYRKIKMTNIHYQERLGHLQGMS